MPIPLIVHRVTKRFVAGVPGCSASVLALQRASVVVHAAEVVAIVGPPGSGKSTLLLCAAGLLRPDSGDVWWFERYNDVGSCSSLVRFVRHGPETPRMIACALDRGAKLLVIDVASGSCGAPESAELGRLLAPIIQRGASAIFGARDARMAAALGARPVALISGRTDISDEASLSLPPRRVAEPFPVDPPFGWV